jgi:type VI secretion system secreted protein Hcp
MKNKMLGSLVLAVALLANAPSAFADLNAYLRIKAAKQGDIKGSVTQKGREDTIMVIAYNHDILSPIDVASGMASGKTKHGLFTIVKERDKSTPLLYQALLSNENLPEVRLEFWSPSASGKEIQDYTVKLTNAHIVKINSAMLNNKSPENMQHKATDEVSFAYQKIEWTWMDGGITFAGDWTGSAR